MVSYAPLQLHLGQPLTGLVVEILPYTIRAKGIALFWLFTGICGAFNTYVNPLGIQAFGWKFYFFYVAWIIVQFVVVYVFFIEVSLFFRYLCSLCKFLGVWLMARFLRRADERPESRTDRFVVRWQGRNCQQRQSGCW